MRVMLKKIIIFVFLSLITHKYNFKYNFLKTDKLNYFLFLFLFNM